MARTFAYCRVSTADQTTDNQIQEIAAAGFAVEAKRVIVETGSGSTAALERKGLARRVGAGGIGAWVGALGPERGGRVG